MERMSLNGENSAKMLLALGIAAIVAVICVVLMWSMGGKYKVLFSNFNDKDGGAIVAALEQMNVPYKLADGGASILVPEDQVYQARLRLASMGLPRAGNVGFELLENQKFGVSQFVEQVNYQRALEGELERSIQAISGVDNARVHLAIPKSTVFIREDQKPTASVLVKLAPGRSLEQRQVSAIVHLVSSSVPNLSTSGVDIVDSGGNLLSDQGKKGEKTLDASQMKYVDEIQRNVAKRVQSIITPIVGAKNVKAEANAEIDFSTIEEANEIFKPNQDVKTAAIRSMQTYEANQPVNGANSGGGTAGGVPGAASNQPAANANAPIANARAGAGPAGDTPAPPVMGSDKKTLTNYEINKTVTYEQKSMGGIKRLSVAVVVNNKQEVDKDGNITSRPLNDDEKAQISELAKKAMGFNEERGDSLSVVNTPFTDNRVSDIPDLPVWKNASYIDMAKESGKIILSIIIAFLLYRKALKPMMSKWASGETIFPGRAKAALAFEEDMDDTGMPVIKKSPYQRDIDNVQSLARDNPKVVADVVSNWVSGNASS
ncbi:flagellar M-ring protein FliF [Polynucleobacter sp. UK-Mo-2m-Kol15]|nr:flagellar basal-body MS-ring/collar protein FliF [Polynucleobacter sp. UK-Mo-2m-Kol15]MBU3575944.1 flagellar M-ring protein FliF [Polynucleobacter sp. UK-Mo-2m-Kol15]